MAVMPPATNKPPKTMSNQVVTPRPESSSTTSSWSPVSTGASSCSSSVTDFSSRGEISTVCPAIAS